MSNLHSGVVMCRYVAEIQYDGKTALEAYTPRMNVVRRKTEQETEAEAMAQAVVAVARMWKECFPDGTPVPKVKSVRLGHSMFVPDDFEWGTV